MPEPLTIRSLDTWSYFFLKNWSNSTSISEFGANEECPPSPSIAIEEPSKFNNVQTPNPVPGPVTRRGAFIIGMPGLTISKLLFKAVLLFSEGSIVKSL